MEVLLYSLPYLYILEEHTNSECDQLPVSLLAQLVKHCTSIAEIIACSRRSDSRAREKNSRRKKKRRRDRKALCFAVIYLFIYLFSLSLLLFLLLFIDTLFLRIIATLPSPLS